jgi:hypothetical protein
MSKRTIRLCALCALVLIAVGLAAWLVLHTRMPVIESSEGIARLPRISPDYAGVVIPPNIAPLNFVVKEPGNLYCVIISSAGGRPIHVHGHDPEVSIPLDEWRALLEANRGRELTIQVYARTGADHWHRFAPIVNTIAEEEIDPYLVYREMPVYNLVWTDMGIYQRDLRSFDQETILRNEGFDKGCCNCHTFLNNRPDRMLMNVRRSSTAGPDAPKGGMVIVRDGVVEHVVDTKTEFNPIPAIYLAWHPGGKVIAFSFNKVLQRFHTKGACRDVVDAYSDLALYVVDTNTVTSHPAVASADRMETYPAWSPDGKHLYFCSAPQFPLVSSEDGENTLSVLYRKETYDLMRIRYDVETGEWGTLETVIAAQEVGLSIAMPRISPDGRFLLCCMMDRGNFPPFNRTSDLYMLDLQTREPFDRPFDRLTAPSKVEGLRKLDINSPFADSHHGWSSNGRWIVFSSKRGDGEFARPYISYVDATGRAHKPILLPQEDPGFYEHHIRAFNVPELIAEPVRVTQRDLLDALYSPEKGLKANLAPGVKPNETVLKAAGRLKTDETPIQ